MPGGDGISLARQLRKAQPEVGVILISGHTDEDILKKAASCTDMLFLEKPFTSLQIQNCLRKLEDPDKGE